MMQQGRVTCPGSQVSLQWKGVTTTTIVSLQNHVIHYLKSPPSPAFQDKHIFCKIRIFLKLLLLNRFLSGQTHGCRAAKSSSWGLCFQVCFVGCPQSLPFMSHLLVAGHGQIICPQLRLVVLFSLPNSTLKLVTWMLSGFLALVDSNTSDFQLGSYVIF